MTSGSSFPIFSPCIPQGDTLQEDRQVPWLSRESMKAGRQVRDERSGVRSTPLRGTYWPCFPRSVGDNHKLQGHCCHLLFTHSPSRVSPQCQAIWEARPFAFLSVFICKMKTTVISTSYSCFYDEIRLYFILYNLLFYQKKKKLNM